MRRIAFFEDHTARQFNPIALLRPVFELRCGHFSLRERTLRLLPACEWGAILRPELAEMYRDEQPQSRVNDPAWLQRGPVLMINGRCLMDPQLLVDADRNTAGWIDDTLAYVVVEPADSWSAAGLEAVEELEPLAKKKRPVQAEGTLLNYPWDLVAQNTTWLENDFRLRDRPQLARELDPRTAIVGPAEDVVIDATAQLDPFVVIDSTSGPVWIDQRARVQAFTRIEGPAYIGPECQLFRANVRAGCSFGPVCRVGGEVEESIIHGHANKYHDGFLGHSYVCPWVNLGALTTNSDLKNDYSAVSVPLAGERVSTGSTKVGCFIGDHTKTALCSLFNTGAAIGVMSQILPAGELLPKHVPSFTRLWHGRLEALPDGCRSAIETARIAMSRRNVELTPALERLIHWTYDSTAEERQRALARQDSR